MSAIQRSTMKPLPGYKSQEVALFIAQMDDQSRRLAEGTRELTPAELEWQPRPGMNTIGMLLAHIAIVEVFWTLVVLKKEPEPAIDHFLAVGADDDGMPLPEEGKPPANLSGKDLAYFDNLLARARTFLKETAAGVLDGDLEHEIVRTRPDGTKRSVDVRWYFYHILEHLSGHFGQVLLLRHLYKASVVPAKV